MKCRMILSLSLVFTLAFCYSAFSQDSPSASPSIDTPPEASANPSPQQPQALTPPSNLGNELSQDSKTLYSIADKYDKIFSGLKQFLQAAGISGTQSDQSLDTSIRLVLDSITSGKQAQQDLDKAIKQARSQRIELWIWRGIAACALGFATYEAVKK